MPPIAILAGGLATRLRPVTERIPKSLIEVAGEPFIFHQLRLLRREGFTRVVLCVGYLGEMIQDRVGDGQEFGLKVSYSFDGETLLGTGGALHRALPMLGETFFVLYGDSYLDIAYLPVFVAFQSSGALALMTVMRNMGRWDTSNVVFAGTRVVRYHKRDLIPEMQYIDYGLGILTADVLTSRPEGMAFDLAEVYSALAASGQLAGYEVTKRFYEIGTLQGIEETQSYLRGSENERH
jgi:NDP-sugar pyrophosphorylase family protein